MPSSIFVSITERDILKVILEFLECRRFHIAQLSLERETGVVNGDFSDDVLFLRQLILDGQWDSALDFIEPLKEVPEFDMRSCRYFITKYKYYELLCIKQDPGPMHDNDFAVEEIVECLKELEDLCLCSEDFRRLCAFLTLKKLSDHDDMKNWNPSSARMECFYKIFPLVSDLLCETGSKSKAIDDDAVNERLIQLVTKGLLYEASVDYCQNQALQGKNAPQSQCKFTNLLLSKPKLSSTDLSLVSWLEVLGNDQFTIPFQQKSLEFKLENLRKPKLEAQWAEQILATPIKPGGQFPYSLVPHVKLKCAEKMSQSMIVPAIMSSSLAVEPYMLNNRKPQLQLLSQSTTAALDGFSINIKTLDDELMIRQSQLITNMLENVSENSSGNVPLSNSSGVFMTSISQSIGSASSLSTAGNLCLKPELADNGVSNSRCELDAICRRNQLIPPSTLRNTSLPPVPELPTPGSIAPSFADHVKTFSNDNSMVNSKLFQEFTNKNGRMVLSISPLSLQQQNLFQGNDIIDFSNEAVYNHSMSMQKFSPQHPMVRKQMSISSQVQQQTQQIMSHQNYNNNRPMSMFVLKQPSQQVNSFCQQMTPRPKSFIDEAVSSSSLANNLFNNSPMVAQQKLQQYPVNVGTLDDGKNLSFADRQSLNDENLPIQFVSLCRYEDSQAIRAVAFHPSGKFFAIGTNSKQLVICKYPDIRHKTLQKGGLSNSPEILLSRPKQHRGSVYCCGFNLTGELLATGSNDKTLRLMAFNADDCKIGAEMELAMHDGTIRELIFMEDTSNYSSILVSGGAGNCHICLTDCATGQTFKSFTGHTAPILGLYSWGPGTCFASCSQDKTIRFWDLRASSAVNIIAPNVRTSNSPVTSVCVDPSGKLLVSGHEDASVMLYDIIGGRTVQIFRPHGDEVRTVRCSNAAYYLLSGSYDKRVVITDIRGDLTAPLMYLPVAEHTDKIIQCRWHPQDFTFLSTSADRTAVLWSLPRPP